MRQQAREERDAADRAAAGPVVTVGDLTDTHRGWQIQVNEPPIREAGFLYGPTHRTFTLGGIRRWTYEGTETVGLLDTDATHDGLFRGTERHYPPDRPCQLLRLVRRPRKAAR